MVGAVFSFQHLENQLPEKVHFPIRQASAHGGSSSWGEHGIENVAIQTDPQLRCPVVLQPFIHPLKTCDHADAVDVVHGYCEPAWKVLEHLLFAGVQIS